MASSLIAYETCWSLYSKTLVLSTGCVKFDRFLNGGFRPGITELVGESGTGKSQLASQLLLQVQLPMEYGGMNGAAAHISIGNILSQTRLAQLIERFRLKHPWLQQHEFRDHIFLDSITDLADHGRKLFTLLPALLKEHSNIRLLVIDSIASLFRAEFKNSFSDMITRTELFFQLASHLKRLSHDYNMVIIIINQVTDLPDSSFIVNNTQSSNNTPSQPRLFTSSSYQSYLHSQMCSSSGIIKTPALGLSWSHCVNSRFFFTRSAQSIPTEVSKISITAREPSPSDNDSNDLVTLSEPIRRIHIILSPYLPSQNSFRFRVTQDGIVGVDE